MERARAGLGSSWRSASPVVASRDRMATSFKRKDQTMTADQLAANVEALVQAAREGGMSDEEIAAVLHDAADALLEGLT
jgi:hypothetical protein